MRQELRRVRLLLHSTPLRYGKPPRQAIPPVSASPPAAREPLADSLASAAGGHALTPDIGLTSGRPCSALGLTACPATPKPRPAATHSRPEVRASRPRVLWTGSQGRHSFLTCLGILSACPPGRQFEPDPPTAALFGRRKAKGTRSQEGREKGLERMVGLEVPPSGQARTSERRRRPRFQPA